MILVAVDDLLFNSKIRTVVKQLGVKAVFARSPDEVLTQARTHRPRLVVFDLNSQKLDPLSTLAALKQDPALAGIHTIGFVSHVRSDLVDAARTAGVDEVLARSAFASRLAEILAPHGEGWRN